MYSPINHFTGSHKTKSVLVIPDKNEYIMLNSSFVLLIQMHLRKKWVF